MTGGLGGLKRQLIAIESQRAAWSRIENQPALPHDAGLQVLALLR